MSDDETNTSDATATMPSNWWATPPSGWDDVSEATFAAWKPDQWAAVVLDAATAQRAMAFGYGSRAAYGTERAWDDVEDHVKADWRESGAEAEVPWDDVSEAVKAGWTAASPAVPGGRPDAPVLAPARFDTPAEPGEHPVPGGRPDRHT